ncbi:AraC-like DNA-binding protein [Enterococcus sp. PF1-24]|uniref:helix-turn-helix domain-containing protein n=1 Tax=unclassified Enterococcus TaxID=2608891 RepID=UPI0024760010|nr:MULTISPECIES: AraC family transcriptional regulator [unclassified Enterococcus]MDH6363739.1 AraC-like DNA-binding protein [Enterococcus sp. PFB1-1]MDH6400695.1 AraC-like DNA-binding protein [Enterococcus sp. PF1-24]
MNVVYCGFLTHNIDQDVIYRPQGLQRYLLLVVLSPMAFLFADGKKQQAKPGACLIYTPNTYQHYYAEGPFFNSFIEFTSPYLLEEKYQLPYNQLFYPENYEAINQGIKKIQQEFLNQFPHKDEMIHLQVEEILIQLERNFQKSQLSAKYNQDLYQELLSLRQQMLANCQQPWTIQQLSQMAKIGKSQFHKLYKELFFSTPKEDLIQARLQKALFEMTNNSLTIKQAAYKAGFQNINHFNRLFKAKFHCSPSQYLKEN